MYAILAIRQKANLQDYFVKPVVVI